MERPADDGAPPVSEKLQVAADGVRQTHWQPSGQRQQAHDSSSLLVMEAKPALALLVDLTFAQSLAAVFWLE